MGRCTVISDQERPGRGRKETGMKKFVVIGHWREEKHATTCVVTVANSLEDARRECNANGFVDYVVIPEKKLETLKGMDSFELLREVEKMTTNCRKWDEIADYIERRMDVMEECIAKCE